MASDIEVERYFALLRFLEGILELLKFSYGTLRLILIFILKAGHPDNIK
jgi:hypothetical protein